MEIVLSNMQIKERGILQSSRWILFFGALGGLLYGVDQGVISGVLLFINNDIPLTSFMEGVVVSSLLLGAIIGSASSGWLSDRDRKSRRLNSSHVAISYAVFCLKKKSHCLV